MRARAPIVPGWSVVAQSLARPYRVTLSMVVLVSLVPVYLFIPDLAVGRAFYRPAIALDDALPLLPSWSIVYGALYLFLIVLPILVVRDEDQIRRTVNAYLTIWLTAYAFFILYPTAAPRVETVVGEGFGAWGLRALYGADPPYNCFPSLHVAHSFVSALACRRVHRGVGIAAIGCAALVAISTVFTKQHYVLDVIGGIALAVIAYAICLRSYPRDAADARAREAAPVLAMLTLGVIALGVACFRALYRFVPSVP